MDATPAGQPGAAVLEWVRGQLDLISCTPHRSRVWAQVWRLTTPDSGWWLKINSEGTRYEPRLLALLNEYRQPLVPTVLVHPSRPWSLIADAGEPARFDLSGPEGERSRAELLDLWTGLVRDYARLQQTMPTGPLLAAGVPDLSPARLPERFDELLERSEWFEHPGLKLERGLRRRLGRLREPVARASAELAEGVPATIQHDDLHDDNVLVRPGPPPAATVIDWGDAVVAHPFGTLRLTLGTLAELLAGPEVRGRPANRAGADVDRLTGVYLAQWHAGPDGPGLGRQLELAHWLECITRAAGWIRALGTVENGLRIGHGEAAANWLLRLESGGPAGRH